MKEEEMKERNRPARLDRIPNLARVPAHLDGPPVRVLLVALGVVDGVQARLLALVEDVVDVVAHDAAVEPRQLLPAVVAHPDGRVVGARHPRAFPNVRAACVAEPVQILLPLDERLALRRAVRHLRTLADDVALWGLLAGDLSWEEIAWLELTSPRDWRSRFLGAAAAEATVATAMMVARVNCILMMFVGWVVEVLGEREQ